ncbi:LOW QUALITY PROTEIN: Endonuclease/exonuclease/phosphatase [Jimgerdemannia flammicorona]|uniref:Endonuclease/exonuclease/phosphatase n=1 Tax=Jimgerdemannia flammicorona TaxID=994334 RepID=A0A433QBB7_9FUNG|nr:LOW QUALITY PROTEIN: Endonuclease/exonuclease/phosphatase [Jimgerdemannia flammicorona]
MAGNKGAVAIRMDYCDTSMCFVAAHLAAGQLAWEDRNNDYHTISEGLFFARGRTIDSHDNVIWVSDLNYRIALSNEELLNQMGARQVFVGYKEGDITFLPTYKYDNGTDVYDTRRADLPEQYIANSFWSFHRLIVQR